MQDNLHASLIDQTGMIHALRTYSSYKLFTFRFHFCLKYTKISSRSHKNTYTKTAQLNTETRGK